MIKVSQIVEEIIKDSPFLEEGLALGIINLTALARRIKPQVDTRVLKKNSIGSIVMALQRLGLSLKKRARYKSRIIIPKDIVLRSNLIELTYANSPSLKQKHQKILSIAESGQDVFFNLLQGIFETSIIASKQLIDELAHLLNSERLILKIQNLASITLRFEQEALSSSGVYYSVLKTLAWAGISVVEVVSINNELSLIVEQNKVDKAFLLIKQLVEK